MQKDPLRRARNRINRINMIKNVYFTDTRTQEYQF